jgi:hypothetical protein
MLFAARRDATGRIAAEATWDFCSSMKRIKNERENEGRQEKCSKARNQYSKQLE